jgi:hypothetical protein
MRLPPLRPGAEKSHARPYEKYLLVVVKREIDNPFIITAFFTDRPKSGTPIDEG